MQQADVSMLKNKCRPIAAFKLRSKILTIRFSGIMDLSKFLTPSDDDDDEDEDHHHHLPKSEEPNQRIYDSVENLIQDNEVI